MEHNPTTLDEILQHARVAEITRHPSAQKSDDRVSSQLDMITEELTRLSARMNSMSTAAVTARPQSVSPGRRQVSFQDQRPRSPSPYRRPEAYRPEQRPSPDSYRQSRPEFLDRPSQQYEPRSSFQPRPAQVNYQRQFTRSAPVSINNDNGPRHCDRCGRLGGHANPQYCPMLTRDCFSCGLRGHASKMCSTSQPSKQY